MVKESLHERVSRSRSPAVEETRISAGARQPTSMVSQPSPELVNFSIKPQNMQPEKKHDSYLTTSLQDYAMTSLLQQRKTQKKEDHSFVSETTAPMASAMTEKTKATSAVNSLFTRSTGNASKL